MMRKQAATLFGATLTPVAKPARSPRRRAGGPVAHPSVQWTLDEGLTVVLFAGLGGACQGLEEAGCPVNVANNHSPVALAAHAALHPHTRHVKGDIFDVDPVQATGGRPVRLLWASPDCRDHSVAKGGAPRSARVRSLPWQVCRWAGKTGALVVMMENVREVRGWGPLVARRDAATGRVVKLDGTVAAPGERVPVHEQQLVRDKRRIGRSFRAFVAHLRRLGYEYQDRDLCCADYGVPTSRRRWFAVARRDGQPIAWPERTHAPAAEAKALGLLPWVGAHTIIDWSLPMRSIFDRPKPLAEATQRRIAVGLERFVLRNPRPFLLPITHGSSPRWHGLDEPLRTITTAHRGEVAVVSPYLAACGGRAAQVPPSAPEEPVGTLTTKGDRVVVGATMLQVGYGERPGQAPRALDPAQPVGTMVASGARHAVAAAWMVQQNFTVAKGVVGADLDQPLSTVVTRTGPQAVAAGYLVHQRGTSTALPGDGPVPTLTSGGGHVAATAAFLVKYYGEGGTTQAADDALHTLSTRARFGVVTVQLQGEPYVLADIGMRMLSAREAAAAHELALPDTIEIGGLRRRLTNTESMHLVGNSVPKRMARLLAEANRAETLYRPASDKLAAD